MAPAERLSNASVISHHDQAPEVATSHLPIYFGSEYEPPQAIDCLAPEVNETLDDAFEKMPSSSSNGSPKRGKMRIGIGVAVGILILTGCLGIGFGVGLRSKPAPSDQHDENKAVGPPPITNGSSGIAAYSCNTTEPSDIYTAPDGTQLREECHVVYREGTLSYNNNTSTIEDISRHTAYTFEECMDYCASRNDDLKISNSSEAKCGAVSYNANLTFAIDKWGANCFIKTGRGAPYSDTPGENYGLVASAYVLNL